MILGYGEDALTLWAIGTQLPRLLRTLGDESPPERSIVLFRPSFGRRGSARNSAGPLVLLPAFGEFDAIIGTAAGTYLIETKWSASSESRGAVLVLRPEQVRRHAVLRCYIEEWRSVRPSCWTEFLEQSCIEDRLVHLGVAVAPKRSRLAASLTAVLGLLDDAGPVFDVILFMRAANELARTRSGSPPTEVDPDTFVLLGVDCRIAESGGFIAMPPFVAGAEAHMWLSPVSRMKRNCS